MLLTCWLEAGMVVQELLNLVYVSSLLHSCCSHASVGNVNSIVADGAMLDHKITCDSFHQDGLHCQLLHATCCCTQAPTTARVPHTQVHQLLTAATSWLGAGGACGAALPPCTLRSQSFSGGVWHQAPQPARPGRHRPQQWWTAAWLRCQAACLQAQSKREGQACHGRVQRWW